MLSRLWEILLLIINTLYGTMDKNKLINIYLSLILSLILIFSVSSCKNQGQGRQDVNGSAVPVVAYTVHTENVVYYDSYPATVMALNEVQLRSEVSGYVTGIYFREGSHITKGEKLYEIDRRKYQAAYEAAKANAEIAGSNLQKALRDAERYEKLDKENAIAKQTLDDGLTALENARMEVKLSNANLVNTETDFAYSLITAPFSGLIGFSSVKPGAFVTAGQTLLNTISSDDPVGLDFFIDQKSLPYYLNLQKNKASAEDSVFKIILPDNSEYPQNGKLSIIDRAVDSQTGTVKIRVVFPNNERILRTGMNCKIEVLNKSAGIQIVIPARAIIEQMSEYMVYLINNGKAEQKRITPGPNLGEFIVVKTGLNPGDKIVLEGIQKVLEGASVMMTDSVGLDAKVTR